jgi:hypothetical protein
MVVDLHELLESKLVLELMIQDLWEGLRVNGIWQAPHNHSNPFRVVR